MTMVSLYKVFLILSLIGLAVFFFVGITYLYNIISKKESSKAMLKSVVVSFVWYVIFFVLYLVVQ